MSFLRSMKCEDMNITVLCVGKLKEKYWTEAVAEYGKRLSRYCNLKMEEVKEARLPDNASAAEEQAVKEEEGKALLRRINAADYVVTLEIKGKRLTSEGLSAMLSQLAVSGRGNVVFVIGGSLGLSGEVSRRADMALSFSDMTFPHQMMRVILLEQIYRGFKIMRNETYHK